MLVIASLTDSLVTFVTDVVRDIGLPGIFVLMLLESACIPIPSEATMLFAGFNVSHGHDTVATITIAGVVGNLVGSWVAYAVGYYGRVGLLERHGPKVGIRMHHLQSADRWFERYGAPSVFFSRLLPIVRTFISLPAGAARMPFWRFSAYTLAGCIPWVLALALIGREVGDRWKDWRHSLEYVDYAVVALIVLGIAYLLIRRWRRTGPAADPAG
ncbi:MAG: DedA family protein [Actinobacteria bacterium]|nr:MAG: DedA family protein [Actinomycetota bacterium]